MDISILHMHSVALNEHTYGDVKKTSNLCTSVVTKGTVRLKNYMKFNEKTELKSDLWYV